MQQPLGEKARASGLADPGDPEGLGWGLGAQVCGGGVLLSRDWISSVGGVVGSGCWGWSGVRSPPHSGCWAALGLPSLQPLAPTELSRWGQMRASVELVSQAGAQRALPPRAASLPICTLSSGGWFLKLTFCPSPRIPATGRPLRVEKGVCSS